MIGILVLGRIAVLLLVGSIMCIYYYVSYYDNIICMIGILFVISTVIGIFTWFFT